MESLLTFVHISDLHFGDEHPNRGIVADSEAPNPFPQPSSPWGGLAGWFATRYANEYVTRLEGHNKTMLLSLHRFYRQLQAAETNVKLVVTGDLTSCGKTQQFERASQFLEGTLPHHGIPIGLNASDWHDYAIFGNHDFWPATALSVAIGFSTEPSGILQLPKVASIPIPGSGRRLTLMRIHTDADVGPFSSDKNLARGHFLTQLSMLDQFLSGKARQAGDVQVLMLHHSYLYRYWRFPIFHPLEITRPSRTQLEAFVDKHQIQVLLTGHTHVPNVEVFHVNRRQVLEACCGTTTQLRRKPTDADNCLMVHRISSHASGGLVWSTQTYRKAANPRIGFEPWIIDPKLRLAVTFNL